jgi:sugar (pentulose or hexulose) kinase
MKSGGKQEIFSGKVLNDPMNTYFIGIDIGTQGARITVLDTEGYQYAIKEETFSLGDTAREEQSPTGWWDTCYRLLLDICQEIKSRVDLSKVHALSVTSTSGTIIPLDKEYEPLHAAIMYSDPRSAAEGKICREAARESGYKGYHAFNSSSGLSKMIWFLNNYPSKVEQLGLFIHAADYITGKLSGNFTVTDYTNALKSGYDVRNFEWPDYLFSKLPLRREWLQQPKPSGMPMGTLKQELALALGLSPKAIVTTGMTDGCASQVASGAVNLGDWNTTIGTTLVVKGVTREEINDPSGAIYCHRHPDGHWMPGGASNTGADWVSKFYGGMDLGELNRDASRLIPTEHLAWPLIQQGERFPFVAPDAMGFKPEGINDAEMFAAYMEGVAYIERYAYEQIKNLSGESVQQVFTAGGASNSDTWLRIRSAVLGLPIKKMKNVSGATGAAIVAASKTYFTSLVEAASNMTKKEKTIEPSIGLVPAYENNYHRFINLLKEKGYITRYELA